MKRILLALLLLTAVAAFADTQYNTFTGYNPYWHPLGYPNTATYGETFLAPGGDTFLHDFSLYLAGPYVEGDIVMSAYLATWEGNHAGTLLWQSDQFDYANTGNAQLTFSPMINLDPNGSYIVFLSISEAYGDSFGQTYISGGNNSCPGCAFAYFNNGGDFNALFTQSWDSYGLSPDFAFTANFTSGGQTVPEPGTFLLFSSGAAGLLGLMRRKFNR